MKSPNSLDVLKEIINKMELLIIEERSQMLGLQGVYWTSNIFSSMSDYFHDYFVEYVE